MDELRNNKEKENSYQAPFFTSNFTSNPNMRGGQSGNFSISLGNDMETEQEAINMIKNQNRKIQELYDELERKDSTIHSMQTQLSTCENYKLQMENYKRQVGILEEKLRLYESDLNSKSNFLQEQLKHVSEAEGKLRNQILNKDKIIHEYDTALKEQEKQLNILKKTIVDKDGMHAELKQDFNEITAKFKNLSLKLNMKEDEFKKIREEQEGKVHDLQKEKSHLEEKLAQLIDIVKQYSKELSEYNVQVGAMETERRSMQKVNSRLSLEIEDKERIIMDLHSEQNIFKETRAKLSDAEEMIRRLEDVIESGKIKFDSVTRQNLELAEKIQIFKEKHSGENSLENLKAVIANQQSEMESMAHNLENINKINKFNENKIQNFDNEVKDLTNNLNNEFKNIIQWIETYLAVFYEQNFEIPDLPLTINKNLKNKFKLDQLKETLQRSRKLINSELSKYENIIKENKKESNDVMNKQEKLIREISDLKNQILNKNEEIFNLSNEVESYSVNLNQNKTDLLKIKADVGEKQEQFTRFLDKLYSTTQKELENVLRNDNFKQFYDYVYRTNYSENLKSQVEDNVEKLIQILHGVLREYESWEIKFSEISHIKAENEKMRKDISDKSRQFKEELENVIKQKEEEFKQLEYNKIEEYRNFESNFNKNVEKLKTKIEEKDEKLEGAQQENTLLKSQIELLEKNINNYSRKDNDRESKEEFDKLNENYKSLEKKIRNLQTEIDLKDLQIKSQEQMISRRTLEINELKSKLGSTSEVGEVNNIDKEKIKTLEADKDKLLKDNLSLMNANYILNSQVNNLKSQFGQTNKSQYAVDEDLLRELNHKLKIAEEEVRNKDNIIKKLMIERKK